MTGLIAKERHTEHRCRSCPRSIKVGEAILEQRLGNDVSYNARVIYFHVECVQRVIDRTPEPVVKSTFSEIRDRMIETGVAYS